MPWCLGGKQFLRPQGCTLSSFKKIIVTFPFVLLADILNVL